DFSYRAPAEPLSPLLRARRMFRREGLMGVLRHIALRFTPPRKAGLGDTWVGLHCAPEPATNPGLDSRFRAALAGYSPRHEYLAPLLNPPPDHRLDQLLNHDLRVYLPSLLHKEDRASMALSLESRAPLLDHRIIEYMATVPPAQKVLGLMPKA